MIINRRIAFQGTKVSWCSWLSRQSNTLKVSGSSPGEANLFAFFFISASFPCSRTRLHTYSCSAFFFSLSLTFIFGEKELRIRAAD